MDNAPGHAFLRQGHFGSCVSCVSVFSKRKQKKKNGGMKYIVLESEQSGS